MIKYGELLNNEFDPIKVNTYNIFVSYFKDPIMTKIKNVDNCSMYITRIHTMVGNTYRYLIVLVKLDDKQNGFEKLMSECYWLSLQTRTLDDIHNLKPYIYYPKRLPALLVDINIKTRDEEQSIYTCDVYSIMLILLHTKKNFKFQYQDKGTILNALETYQTIIYFTK